jgi:hypothetical protein
MSRPPPRTPHPAALPGEFESLRRALDRRAFLRLAAGAAALGILPSGCGREGNALGPPNGFAPRAFTPRSYAVLNAAAVRIVGPRGAEAIRAGRIDPARGVDAILTPAPDVARVFEQALRLLEFGVFPLIGKLRPFTALDGTAQDAVLSELLHSRFELKRAIFGALKNFTTLGFYGSPESDPLTGYPGVFGGERVTIASAMSYELEGP